MRIGLDIGGTKTDAVVLDAAGTVLQSVRVRTGTGGDEVVASAERAVREVIALSGVAADDYASIGVGIPGVIDEHAGRVHHAVRLRPQLARLARRRLTTLRMSTAGNCCAATGATPVVRPGQTACVGMAR